VLGERVDLGAQTGGLHPDVFELPAGLLVQGGLRSYKAACVSYKAACGDSSLDVLRALRSLPSLLRTRTAPCRNPAICCCQNAAAVGCPWRVSVIRGSCRAWSEPLYPERRFTTDFFRIEGSAAKKDRDSKRRPSTAPRVSTSPGSQNA